MLGEQCVTISLDKRMPKLCVLVLVVSTVLVSISMGKLSFCHIVHADMNLFSGAMQISTTFYGSGPIFLDALECTSSDTDLLGCGTTFTSVGLTRCNHSQDVSVRCQGITYNCTLDNT